jgi:hypothetical protein
VVIASIIPHCWNRPHFLREEKPASNDLIMNRFEKIPSVEKPVKIATTYLNKSSKDIASKLSAVTAIKIPGVVRDSGGIHVWTMMAICSQLSVPGFLFDRLNGRIVKR